MSATSDLRDVQASAHTLIVEGWADNIVVVDQRRPGGVLYCSFARDTVVQDVRAGETCCRLKD
eukprot:7016114-Pyramimonas_sp.AAC.1